MSTLYLELFFKNVHRCALRNSFLCSRGLTEITRRAARLQFSRFSTSSCLTSKKRKMAKVVQTPSKLKEQIYDYFLVLDFEATCEENIKIHPQEIIEFPVVKINARTLQVDSTFHQYVQPRVHKQLTPFCTQLTGIIQDMVDGQPHLEDVLLSLDQWMLDNKLLDPEVKSLFVTCGDWDLKTMLPSQSEYFNLPVPKYFSEWLNIKKAFAEVTSTYPHGMMQMLQLLNIQHQGRHHSGIDDCKNIGNILIELLHRGYVGKPSWKKR
ncbi:ERI1 exoribonuclease 3-like [Mya arenaria]|uniref:ERI1 exoribonuclease 3-like n=1 Tax=Mya arenaria TaxID=6604 RepID=UPI0022E94CB1|nr:ERI1 exoribonuclease 3-like [Mya arenaria]